LAYSIFLALFSLALILAGIFWPSRHSAASTLHRNKRSNGALIAVLSGTLLIAWIVGTRIYDLMALGYVDSAIGTLRDIVSNESAFASAHPQQGYTCKLSELANDQVLTTLAKDAVRNGYTFQIDGCASTAKPNRIFHATAAPIRKGMQVFCADESGILKSGESTGDCLVRGVVLQ
jgi:hypothetical protein